MKIIENDVAAQATAVQKASKYLTRVKIKAVRAIRIERSPGPYSKELSNRRPLRVQTIPKTRCGHYQTEG